MYNSLKSEGNTFLTSEFPREKYVEVLEYKKRQEGRILDDSRVILNFFIKESHNFINYILGNNTNKVCILIKLDKI